MTLQSFIKKWQVNKSLIARGIEMRIGTLQNKLDEKHPSKMSETEEARTRKFIKTWVKKMNDDCEKL